MKYSRCFRAKCILLAVLLSWPPQSVQLTAQAQEEYDGYQEALEEIQRTSSRPKAQSDGRLLTGAPLYPEGSRPETLWDSMSELPGAIYENDETGTLFDSIIAALAEAVLGKAGNLPVSDLASAAGSYDGGDVDQALNTLATGLFGSAVGLLTTTAVLVGTSPGWLTVAAGIAVGAGATYIAKKTYEYLISPLPPRQPEWIEMSDEQQFEHLKEVLGSEWADDYQARMEKDREARDAEEREKADYFGELFEKQRDQMDAARRDFFGPTEPGLADKTGEFRNAEPDASQSVPSTVIGGFGVPLLDAYSEGLSSERYRQTATAADAMGLTRQMGQAARAGDQQLLEARQSIRAGGRDAQFIRDESTRAAAQAQRDQSWSKVLGDALTDGVQQGLETFAGTLGAEAGGRVAGEIFGPSREERRAAREAAEKAAAEEEEARQAAAKAATPSRPASSPATAPGPGDVASGAVGSDPDPLGVVSSTQNQDGTVSIRYGCGYGWTGRPPGPSRCPICDRETVATETKPPVSVPAETQTAPPPARPPTEQVTSPPPSTPPVTPPARSGWGCGRQVGEYTCGTGGFACSIDCAMFAP